MSPRLAFLTAALLVCAALPAAAATDPDCDGCKDHPEVPRFAGYQLNSASSSEFDGVELVVSDDSSSRKEGRVWELEYWAPDSDHHPSCSEVERNYESAFGARGGRLVWKSEDECNATLVMPLGSSERWMGLNAGNDGGTYRLHIVELGAITQRVEVTASAMALALAKDGFVALHDLQFDTASDAIKPASGQQLAQVVQLLQGSPTLKLSIEGHTDNRGTPKANLRLSQRRAESVRQFLVAHGIATGRLRSRGLGQAVPVADNRHEAGRALNRRVELVKQ